MDLISNAELVEIYWLIQERVDAQFQYWLSVSFAVIVACFVAGERLNSKLRLLLTALYFLAAGVFIMKYFTNQTALIMYVSEMNSRALNYRDLGASEYLLPTIVWFRQILFLVGTITTIWFLYSNHTQLKDKR